MLKMFSNILLNALKHSPSSVKLWLNKLEFLPLAYIFSLVLYLRICQGAYPCGVKVQGHIRHDIFLECDKHSSQGVCHWHTFSAEDSPRSLPLWSQYRNIVESKYRNLLGTTIFLDSDKHSSLLRRRKKISFVDSFDRFGSSLILLNGRIFVTGGGHGSNPSRIIEEFHSGNGTWCQFYKNFFASNLRIFVINQSIVHPSPAFPAQSDFGG